jgi:hypothetical protein
MNIKVYKPRILETKNISIIEIYNYSNLSFYNSRNIERVDLFCLWKK